MCSYYQVIKTNKSIQHFLIRKIFGDVKSLKSFKSPFRKDRKPSCSVYEKDNMYYFIDFGTGEHYSIPYLYAHLTNKSLYQVIEEYVISSLSLSKKRRPSKCQFNSTSALPSIKSIDKSSKAPTYIDFVISSFSPSHISYLHNYSISIRTSLMFKVYPISMYAIKTTRAIAAPDPTFGIDINGVAKKIYNPTKQLKKNIKFASNASKYRGDFTFINRLSDTNVICSSHKDAMALYEHNMFKSFNVLIPPSETSIPDEMIALAKDYRNIVILDNDDVGIASARKLYANIDREDTDIYLPKLKDIADDFKHKACNHYSRVL